MRIRTVKPELHSHPVVAKLAHASRWLAGAILNYADDEGYFYADPALVRAALDPFSEDSVIVQGGLSDLSKCGFLEIREHPTHGRIGRICSFGKHQKINRPSPSKIKELWEFTESSLNGHGTLTAGTGNREQGTGNGSVPVSPVAPLPPKPPPRRKRTGAYSEEFEQFWEGYRIPSKGSKKKAWAAWQRLGSKRPPAFVLVAAFEAQEGAAKRKRALKQFVPEFPHAERWLRDERFDDEVDDPSAPPVHEAVPQEPLPENWAELVAELYPETPPPSDPADLHPSVVREVRQLAEKRKGGRS